METTRTYDTINVHKLVKVLSEILSEKYGCKVTITAIPKDAVKEESEKKAS